MYPAEVIPSNCLCQCNSDQTPKRPLEKELVSDPVPARRSQQPKLSSESANAGVRSADRGSVKSKGNGVDGKYEFDSSYEEKLSRNAKVNLENLSDDNSLLDRPSSASIRPPPRSSTQEPRPRNSSRQANESQSIKIRKDNQSVSGTRGDSAVESRDSKLETVTDPTIKFSRSRNDDSRHSLVDKLPSVSLTAETKERATSRKNRDSSLTSRDKPDETTGPDAQIEEKAIRANIAESLGLSNEIREYLGISQASSRDSSKPSILRTSEILDESHKQPGSSRHSKLTRNSSVSDASRPRPSVFNNSIEEAIEESVNSFEELQRGELLKPKDSKPGVQDRTLSVDQSKELVSRTTGNNRLTVTDEGKPLDDQDQLTLESSRRRSSSFQRYREEFNFQPELKFEDQDAVAPERAFSFEDFGTHERDSEDSRAVNSEVNSLKTIEVNMTKLGILTQKDNTEDQKVDYSSGQDRLEDSDPTDSSKKQGSIQKRTSHEQSNFSKKRNGDEDEGFVDNRLSVKKKSRKSFAQEESLGKVSLAPKLEPVKTPNPQIDRAFNETVAINRNSLKDLLQVKSPSVTEVKSQHSVGVNCKPPTPLHNLSSFKLLVSRSKSPPRVDDLQATQKLAVLGGSSRTQPLTIDEKMMKVQLKAKTASGHEETLRHPQRTIQTLSLFQQVRVKEMKVATVADSPYIETLEVANQLTDDLHMIGNVETLAVDAENNEFFLKLRSDRKTDPSLTQRYSVIPLDIYSSTERKQVVLRG